MAAQLAQADPRANHLEGSRLPAVRVRDLAEDERLSRGERPALDEALEILGQLEQGQLALDELPQDPAARVDNCDDLPPPVPADGLRDVPAPLVVEPYAVALIALAVRSSLFDRHQTGPHGA